MVVNTQLGRARDSLVNMETIQVGDLVLISVVEKLHELIN